MGPVVAAFGHVQPRGAAGLGSDQDDVVVEVAFHQPGDEGGECRVEYRVLLAVSFVIVGRGLSADQEPSD